MKTKSKNVKKVKTIKDFEEQEKYMQEPLLTEDFEETFTANEPLRDIFSKKNIKFKTELNEEQRSAISILYDTYVEFKVRWGIEITALKNVLDEYVDFGASLDRKSRDEFVKAHQSLMAQQQQQQQQNMVTQATQLKS